MDEDEGGARFTVSRGLVDDPKYSSAFAFFFNEAGVPVYLELPPVGHRSRDELKAKRAALEARRKAPKPRRPWVK